MTQHNVIWVNQSPLQIGSCVCRVIRNQAAKTGQQSCKEKAAELCRLYLWKTGHDMTYLPSIIFLMCLVSYNICMIQHVWKVTFGLNLSEAWGVPLPFPWASHYIILTITPHRMHQCRVWVQETDRAENRLSLYVAVEELEYGKWSVLIVISFAIYKHAEGIKSV